MKILVGNTKGGSGKSILSLNLAKYFGAHAIDCDPQASLHRAMGAELVLTPDALDDALRGSATAVMDVPGANSEMFRAAMMRADIIVIPFIPVSLDLWTLDGMKNLITEANTHRQKPLKTLLVCNRVRSVSSLVAPAIDYAKSVFGQNVPVFKLDNSEALPYAFADGKAIVGRKSVQYSTVIQQMHDVGEAIKNRF
jgi:chromosome partitioning protein